MALTGGIVSVRRDRDFGSVAADAGSGDEPHLGSSYEGDGTLSDCARNAARRCDQSGLVKRWNAALGRTDSMRVFSRPDNYDWFVKGTCTWRAGGRCFLQTNCSSAVASPRGICAIKPIGIERVQPTLAPPRCMTDPISKSAIVPRLPR